jgi:hypothetical protein
MNTDKIIEAEDMLFAARNCVECIFMAARGLGDGLKHDGTDPLQTVADIASKKIDEAIALLVKCRAPDGAGPVPGAPSTKPVSPAARTKRSGK